MPYIRGLPAAAPGYLLVIDGYLHGIQVQVPDYGAASEHGVRRHAFRVIEISEDSISSDIEFMKKQTERFRSLGFAVWMDDYGSGSASPVMLQRVHFDLLKINVGLISRISSSDNTKIIITELVRMAIALGIETAAEGVEDQEQVDFLLEVGCSKMQGFYYCRPIPVEKIFARYKSGTQIGFENPDEAEYYSEVGKVSLYDLSFLMLINMI